MTASVLALTRYDRLGASSRVRFLQYVPHLERKGLSVSVEPLLPREYLAQLYRDGTRSPTTVAAALINRFWRALSQKNHDVIWLQREILPFLPFALEKILLSDKPVIIDFDDAHHLYYKGLRSSLLRSVFADKIENLMRHATTVVVGNGMLEDYARAVGAKDVALIPSAVDVAHYKMIQSANDRFTIGWIGTPVTAKQSLPLLRGPFQKFLSETGSRCVLIGAGEDQSLGIDADRLSWSEAGEADFFAQITVGLCPLEDTPWNRGKSGYKIIQYMAAGKPALVSPVGIAGDLITHGETGFYCRSEEDWYTFLMQLYQDKELRFAMGARAQAEAETKYDTALAADKLYQIFEACL